MQIVFGQKSETSEFRSEFCELVIFLKDHLPPPPEIQCQSNGIHILQVALHCIFMALQHIELMSTVYVQVVQQPKKHQKEPRKVPKGQQ